MDNKIINDNLVDFWNESIKLSNEQKDEMVDINPDDYIELAPSKKLFDNVKELGKCHKVLDYGCGNGWASIIVVRSGCQDVTAVDMGEGIVDAVNFYAKLFNAQNNLKAFSINEDWLSTVPSETYDGLICSNVLDVVPLETAKYILKELARILTKDAKIIISMNFYLSEEMAKSRNMELVEGKYLFVNNILRLTSLSDKQWKELFSPFFDVDSLDYFAWPGENKETRRLFVLRKK